MKAGKQPFSDYAIAVYEVVTSGNTPAKAKYAKHLNDVLKVNALKHMVEGEDDTIEFDVDIAAFGAILKAVTNYLTLHPEKPDFIKALLYWVHTNFNGEKFMENYHSRPKKLRALDRGLPA